MYRIARVMTAILWLVNIQIASAQTFADVPTDYWAHSQVEILAANGITAGCGGGNFCPEDAVTRAQMAVFLERGMNGSSFSPAPATGNVFLDVGAGDFAAAWIEQLYTDGITAGCGNNKYCPGSTVTRDQMAVFLLRAKYGAMYSPPTATGVFADVDLGHWAVHWIEALAAEGITVGCGNGNYCPEDSVTRAQMAVFLVRAFDLVDPTPPPTGWQPGVFQPEETFALRCVTPGNSMQYWTGQPVPDVQGTVLDENNYLRSWSNRTYLWYDEITDRDPAGFDNPVDYFAVLKTFATAPSGANKDKYHFTRDTQEYYQLTQAGVSAGYGAEWALLSAIPPRDVRVAYTEPDSPVTENSVMRGAKVLAIDGFDIDTNTQQGVNALNAGLFPATVGETHEFTVEDPDGTVRTITMVSAEIVKDFVQATQVIDTPSGGRVGYMLFTAFRGPAEADLVDAVNTLNAGEGITDLVLDLRYNGGGFLGLSAELAYMIAGPTNTAGSFFALTQFNDKYPSTNPITGQPITSTPFISTSQGYSLPVGQPLPTLGLSRVYILTGFGTASASEVLINGLRGAGIEVIQIGATTNGKPYGFYPQDNCGTLYFSIQMRSVNNANYGEFTDGFVPSATDNGEDQILGCAVADDFSKQLGDPAEDRLEVALGYIEGRSCITPAVAAGQLGKATLPTPENEPVIMRPVVETLLIMDRF